MIHIIALQECYQIHCEDEIRLNDYNFIYQTRKNNAKGGGIFFYVHNSLKFNKIEKLSYFEDRIFESLTIEVMLGANKKILCSNVYRSPTILQGYTQMTQIKKFTDYFSKLQSELSSYRCDSYILSDTNIDLLKFDSFSYIEEFLENCYADGFLPLCTRPSRAVHTSISLIDNIFTNSLANVYKSGILLIHESDHFPVFHASSHKTTKVKPKIVKYRHFSDENIERFKILLGNTNWDNVYNCNEADTSFNVFISEFSNLFDICFPVTKRKFNKNHDAIEPFMSSALLKSRNTKLSLHSKKNQTTFD